MSSEVTVDQCFPTSTRQAGYSRPPSEDRAAFQPRYTWVFEDGCEFVAKNVLHRDLRLPDELPRLGKGRGLAHLGGLSTGATRRGCGPDLLQHMLHPRQSRAEGLSPPSRFQKATEGREALCRSRLRGAAGGPAHLRARAARVAGGRLGVVPQLAGDAGAD